MDDRSAQMVREMVDRIRKDAETENAIGARIAKRTNLIASTVLILLALSGILLLVMVKSLTSDFLALLHHMDVMYEHFVIMSDNMESITRQITQINQHVTGIPEIANNMIQMNRDVASMHGNMNHINATMAAMENSVANMTGMTSEMAGRFGNVNSTVQGMGYNVNQMARPTDMMEMLAPFGFSAPFR
ncbi:MAG: hypothetical protein G8345_11035 [Magnetococcales bacterium]|nr:hypothetical protein [Magnetococcales bacterium]NGZ27407.1 hypothetical protein [Magnetococcales bacterium]